jgi:hypothetical protein
MPSDLSGRTVYETCGCTRPTTTRDSATTAALLGGHTTNSYRTAHELYLDAAAAILDHTRFDLNTDNTKVLRDSPNLVLLASTLACLVVEAAGDNLEELLERSLAAVAPDAAQGLGDR